MEETLNPRTQTQQAPQPFFPQHTPTKNSKSSGSSSFICCLSHFFGVHKTQMSVRPSVLFYLSLLFPFHSKFKSKKKPGIFNLNRPNPKLDPTLWYSNSSTSRYPRTKFSKEKKTRPYVRHPLTISQIPTHSSTKPKRTNFCKSRSFYLTTLLWIFMLLGEARKEGSDKN
jgi:hypothetical protein